MATRHECGRDACRAREIGVVHVHDGGGDGAARCRLPRIRRHGARVVQDVVAMVVVVAVVAAVAVGGEHGGDGGRDGEHGVAPETREAAAVTRTPAHGRDGDALTVSVAAAAVAVVAAVGGGAASVLDARRGTRQCAADASGPRHRYHSDERWPPRSTRARCATSTLDTAART